MNKIYQAKLMTSVKYLAIAISTAIAMNSSHADVNKKKIGDLEIYQAAEGGKTTLMLMLDISGSMGTGSIANDYGFDYNYSDTASYGSHSYNRYLGRISKRSGDSYSAIKNGCTLKSDGYYYCYDRISRLKDGIFDLLYGNSIKNISRLSDDKVIGLATLGAYSNGYKNTGAILVPARALNTVINGKTQRELILDQVEDLRATTNTPTAQSYAEVAAYLMGTSTKNPLSPTVNGTNYSGMQYSSADTMNSGKTSYIMPNSLSSQSTNSTASCSGQGIYVLTDGQPNLSSTTIAGTIMGNALGQSSRFSCSSTWLSSTEYNSDEGWECIGDFSQALLNPTRNPARLSFKTAVVGFGTDFNNIPTYDKTKTTAENVSAINSISNSKAAAYVKMAAKWGVYGGGGWYPGSSSDDVVSSVNSFLDELNNTLPATPSGTIVVPDDPYRADSQLAVAYYPILQAKVDENPAIWAGNLKKYSLNEGTLFGKNSSKLFQDAAGELNPDTEDLWSAAADEKGNNANVNAGGFFGQLRSPNTVVENVRTLYIEDAASATDATPRLRKLGVNNVGKITLDGNVMTKNNTFIDTATYTRDTVNVLLQFLGFSLTDTQKTQALTDLVLTKPSSAVKILGATIHSTPSMVSYAATLDDDGKVSDTRDDYTLFGSSDGALHLVNADDHSATGNGGKEQFAFIPKQILINQPQALINGTGTDTGKPYFGVDAPWLVSANYFYDLDNSRVTVQPCPQNTTIDPTNSRECRNTHVRAYGGLRMGGEGLYGLDLLDKANPKLLFKLDASKPGFERMGQIWAKPTRAKIATGYDANRKKVTSSQDVLVFGGGYDTCYENEGFQVGVTDSTFATDVNGTSCSNKSEARGNAVYIVDAKTGGLIWSATKTANTVTGATNTTVSTLNNSVVGGITVLDRNNDGYMDQLYFADLGGQVFRADFTNAGFVKPVTSGTPSPETRFSNTRVVRILQPAFSGAETKYNHRFYERPVVSFYRGDSTFNNDRLFAVVNVISGDRSSPLSKIRSDNKYADRLYGIMDTDVTLDDNTLYASDFATRIVTPATKTTPAVMAQKIKDLTSNDLVKLPFGTVPTTGYTLADKQQARDEVKAKRGWYYPLTRFDGFDQVKYTKGMGKSEVISSFLYTTVYNPDMTYGKVEPCAAKITGGSERQLYCLPYGICLNEKVAAGSGAAIDEYAASKNGTGGFMRAGQGIQELALGPRSSTLSNQRLLIGTHTLTDRVLGRVNFGDDNGKLLAGDTGSNDRGIDKTSQPLSGLSKATGDGSAAENLYNERYTIQPNTWYEVSVSEK